MGFIGSTAYYVLCASILVSLIILLIALQIKPKQKPRKTEPRHQQASADYIPKYAAGDDMDRINRKASTLGTEKKPSLIPIPLAIIIIFAVLFLAPLSNRNRTIPTQTTPPPSPTHPSIPVTVPVPTETGKLQIELNSADFSNDHSKIFVTYTYTNDTNSNFYSIITTIDLEDENDTVIQRKTADTVDVVNANDSKEITVPVIIEPENIGKVKRVMIHTTYQHH